MDVQEVTRLTDEAAAKARRDHLLHEIATRLVVVGDEERSAVAELLCGWLEIYGGGAPRLDQFGDIREDAAFWADMATPIELEAYVGHGLRRIERASFAQGARKRLFVMLWESMSISDRRAFVRRVDPQGKFHKDSA